MAISGRIYIFAMLIGRERKRAIAKYMDFVRKGVGLPSLWSELSKQIYLGGDDFVERIPQELAKNADLSEIPRMQRRRPQAKPLVYYVGLYKDKKRGIVEAYQTDDYTMKEIAAEFEVHYSTVSRAIKSTEQQNAWLQDLSLICF
jgi:putative transposase